MKSHQNIKQLIFFSITIFAHSAKNYSLTPSSPQSFPKQTHTACATFAIYFKRRKVFFVDEKLPKLAGNFFYASTFCQIEIRKATSSFNQTYVRRKGSERPFHIFIFPGSLYYIFRARFPG